MGVETRLIASLRPSTQWYLLSVDCIYVVVELPHEGVGQQVEVRRTSDHKITSDMTVLSAVFNGRAPSYLDAQRPLPLLFESRMYAHQVANEATKKKVEYFSNKVLVELGQIWLIWVEVVTFECLTKVAIFNTNIIAENQTLINHKAVCGALSRHFCQTLVIGSFIWLNSTPACQSQQNCHFHCRNFDGLSS